MQSRKCITKIYEHIPPDDISFWVLKKNAKWQTDHQASPFFNRTNGTNEHCPTPQGHNRQNILFLNMCMKITKTLIWTCKFRFNHFTFCVVSSLQNHANLLMHTAPWGHVTSLNGSSGQFYHAPYGPMDTVFTWQIFPAVSFDMVAIMHVAFSTTRRNYPF